MELVWLRKPWRLWVLRQRCIPFKITANRLQPAMMSCFCKTVHRHLKHYRKSAILVLTWRSISTEWNFTLIWEWLLLCNKIQEITWLCFHSILFFYIFWPSSISSCFLVGWLKFGSQMSDVSPRQKLTTTINILALKGLLCSSCGWGFFRSTSEIFAVSFDVKGWR